MIAQTSSIWPANRLAGSAIGSGANSYHTRSSDHSLTGAVLVAGFGDHSAASRFAQRWAKRLPRRCRGAVVRRADDAWVVSVPVAGVAS